MNVPLHVPLLMIGLLGVSAFFSASETAIFSLEPLEVRRRSERGSLFHESFAWCIRHARAVLVTILLTNLAANTLYFTLAGSWAKLEGGWLATAIPVIALMALVFVAEILPKSIALGLAGPLASTASPVLHVWARVLAPLRAPLGAAVQFLSRRLAPHGHVERTLAAEELEKLVHKNPERFGLGARSADLVSELVHLHDIQVREVMVPIVDLRPIPETTPCSEALTELLDKGWRWLLVSNGERVTGYVDAKQLLVADSGKTVHDELRRLEVIPELARLPHLLSLLKGKQVDRVLVVDEYGQDAGIVGREDLTDHIFGGLVRSEHVEEEMPIRYRKGRGWEIVGTLGVHEFEDVFSVRMPIHRNRTIAGLVVEQFGRLPERGDEIEIAGLHFTVLGSNKGRVHKLLVSSKVAP